MKHRKPDNQEYEVLDRYLKTAFQMLEGFTDIESARHTLSGYLDYHRAHQLPGEFEDFLIRLFFAKCAREFALKTDHSSC